MYLAFARSAFQTDFAYRAQVWASIFGEIVYVFSRIAIWTSLMASGAAVAGATLPDMVTYSVLAGTVLGAWDISHFLNTITRSLKSGDIATHLLRPIAYPAQLFATECGHLAFRTVAIVLPVTIIAMLAYGLKPPASLVHGLSFPLFWGLSFLILFELACIGGMLAFWLLTAFSIDWLLRALISFLSGAIIPLWFFPGWLADIAQVLPFAWLSYYPAAVYLGKIVAADLVPVFALGSGWAVLLALGIWALWRKATLRLTVQGG